MTSALSNQDSCSESTCGDSAQAFYWLDRAYDQHAPWLVYSKVTPVYDNLRSDPRFKAFLQRLGL